MPSMTSTVGGTKFGTPQKLPATVGRLAGRLARGKGTQTKCIDAVAASFSLSTKHRLLSVSPGDTGACALHALVAEFAPDGEQLIIGTAQGAVYKVDLLTFKFFLLAYVKDTITCLAVMTSDSGTHVIAGQKNGQLICFNQDTHETGGDRSAHSAAVLGVCAGQQETVCSYSRSEAFVWRGSQLRRLYQLHLNSSACIVKMVFLSDGALLGGFADDSVYVWSLESLQVTHEVLQLSRHRPGIADIAAAHDSDVFYAAGKTSQVFEFSLGEMRVTRIFSLPDGSGHVTQVMVFPGPFHGQILSVLLENGAFKFIHSETGRVVQSLSHSKHPIAHGSASRSGLFLACRLGPGHICLHHSTGEVFRRIVLPEAFYEGRPRVLLVDESPSRLGRGRAHAASLSQTAPPPGGGAGAPQKPTKEKRGRTPLLNTTRLAPIVREHGEFPAQYRRLIWRHLLELPGAHALYVTLSERGQHPAWRHVAHRYPVRDVAVAKVLSSTLSALAWWCPLFAEVEFLPYLVFPFCSMFSADPLTALELVITVLVNWCQRWFEFFPYPPISVLGMVENLLAHHCPDLLRHYMSLGVTAHVYAWPLLETALSEVFTQHDWLVAWDHIFSREPSFLLSVVVAYNVVSQPALHRCKTADDIGYYFRNQNVVSVRHVMRRAHQLHDATPADLHPRAYMEPFEAIGAAAYPVFNKYPTFIVNHQLEERERISREHSKFLEERGATAKLAFEMADDRSKHKQWAEKLAYLKDAEAAHREMLRRSEAKLTAQRRRLAALQAALRQRSSAQRHSERSRALLQQTTEKEMLIGRLQDEIKKKREESDAISRQLRQEERDGPVGSEEISAPPRRRSRARSGSSSASSTRGSPSAARSDSSSPVRRPVSGRRTPPPLVSARSSSTYASAPSVAGSLSRATVPRARPPSARLSPTHATVPRVTPPRRRTSPPADAQARAAAARAAARVAAVRRTLPNTSPRRGSPRRRSPVRGASPPEGGAARSARGGATRTEAQSPPPAGSPRRSSLQLNSPRSDWPATTRRVRMVPGSVDADIGELEREIDEIAADVASLAQVSAPPPAPGGEEQAETYGSAASFSTWNSRSAPDVASLLGAHASAQRTREQLVAKWREEEQSSQTDRALRGSRSQLQQTVSQQRRRSGGSKHRSRQTIVPRRQTSFRSML